MQALEMKWFAIYRTAIGIVALAVAITAIAVFNARWLSNDDSITATHSTPPIPGSHVMRVYEWNTTLPETSLSPLPMPRGPRLPGADTRY